MDNESSAQSGFSPQNCHSPTRVRFCRNSDTRSSYSNKHFHRAPRRLQGLSSTGSLQGRQQGKPPRNCRVACPETVESQITQLLIRWKRPKTVADFLTFHSNCGICGDTSASHFSQVMPEIVKFWTLFVGERGNTRFENATRTQRGGGRRRVHTTSGPCGGCKVVRGLSAWVRDDATRKSPRLPAVKAGKLLRPVDVKGFIKHYWRSGDLENYRD